MDFLIRLLPLSEKDKSFYLNFDHVFNIAVIMIMAIFELISILKHEINESKVNKK